MGWMRLCGSLCSPSGYNSRFSRNSAARLWHWYTQTGLSSPFICKPTQKKELYLRHQLAELCGQAYCEHRKFMVSSRPKLLLMALCSQGGFQGQTLNNKLNLFKLQTSMLCPLYCCQCSILPSQTQVIRLFIFSSYVVWRTNKKRNE